MTVKEAFSPEEWALLVELPREAAIAAAVADADDTLDATKAIVAAFKELVGGSYEHPDNDLIVEVLAELRTGDDGPEDQSQTIEIDKAARARRRTDVLAHARQANDLLRAKGDPTAADEYRRWVLAIGREAVKAAESGGFLGLGGKRVSDDEASLMGELREALGVGR
jgi:hypothetical protein